MNTQFNNIVLTLLKELTLELKALQLWSDNRPSENSLSSVQPFCIDTLNFEQWLQFVFIERLIHMTKNNMALPTKISISPMAEEYFKNRESSMSKLINVIKDIDRLLSGKGYEYE